MDEDHFLNVREKYVNPVAMYAIPNSTCTTVLHKEQAGNILSLVFVGLCYFVLFNTENQQ